jgi:hypothetical protein
MRRLPESGGQGWEQGEKVSLFTDVTIHAQLLINGAGSTGSATPSELKALITGGVYDPKKTHTAFCGAKS